MNTLTANLRCLLVIAAMANFISAENYETSIVFPSMTISRADIERECPFSTGFPLYSIKLYIGYAFADKTSCSPSTRSTSGFHADMIIEWVPGIPTLLNFPNNASRVVENCMNDPTCQTVHLDEWMQLTKTHMNWCSTCFIQRDGSCPEVITERSRRTQTDPLQAIVDTMFLYAEINCTIKPEISLIEFPVHYDRLNQPMINNLSLNSFQQCMSPTHRVEVLSVIQQAPAIRYRNIDPTANDSRISSLREEVSKIAVNLPSEPINWLIEPTSLDVIGGYWWGTGHFSQRNHIPPTSLLVIYQCMKLTTTPEPMTDPSQISESTTSSWNETKFRANPPWSAAILMDRKEAENEPLDLLVVGLASGGAGILLVMVVIIIAIALRRQHRQRSIEIRNNDI